MVVVMYYFARFTGFVFWRHARHAIK